MYSDVNIGEHHGSRVKSTRNFRGMGGGKRQRAAILKPCDEGRGGWAPPCLTMVLLFLDSCILFYPEIVFGPNLVLGHPSLPMRETRLPSAFMPFYPTLLPEALCEPAPTPIE
jgi:hypothetical protein